MNYYTNNIKHVKGDTFSCALVVEDLGQDLDGAFFTCRDSLNEDANILFQCSLNDGITLVEYDAEKDIRKYAVRVDPNKTKDIEPGYYYYDEEIRVNDDVFTLMKGQFIIEQDSSKGGN